MATWTSWDGKPNLLKIWLDQFRARYGITSTDASLSWRQMDEDSEIAAKILRCYKQAYGAPSTYEYQWMKGDSENDCYRKILKCIRFGITTAQSGPAYEWRQGDVSRNIQQKILRVVNDAAYNSNPTYFPSAFDNEIWCLRKIADLQASIVTSGYSPSLDFSLFQNSQYIPLVSF